MPVPRMETGQKRILIIEDNEMNMKLFHCLREVRGYMALQIKGGCEALQLARQHPRCSVAGGFGDRGCEKDRRWLTGSHTGQRCYGLRDQKP